MRQVGIVDGAGEVAVHTGESCIPCAGHATGAHVSAQANMMERETVPAAMVAGFEAATGDLADRLMAALHAAEGEGGDVRGRQSSALVVVPREGEPWRARFELRVEDHEEPVEELGRLLRLARAYELAGEADELMASDRTEEAGGLYLRAAELAPESDELLFWAGLAQVHAGDVQTGMAAVRRAIELHPGWFTLLERLSPDFAPAGERVRRELELELDLDQQITCRWNGRPVLPSAASRWSTRTWFVAGPPWVPREKSAELPVTFAVYEHLLTSLLNVTV